MRVPFVAWKKFDNRIINVWLRGSNQCFGFGQNVLTPSMHRGYIIGFRENGNYMDALIRVGHDLRLVWVEYLRPIASQHY